MEIELHRSISGDIPHRIYENDGKELVQIGFISNNWVYRFIVHNGSLVPQKMNYDPYKDFLGAIEWAKREFKVTKVIEI